MASAKSLPVYCVFFIVMWSAVVAIPSQPARGTVKTIHSEDGDVIDCVDIYQQPSLDHPLLKNEKSKIPEYLKRFNNEHKNDETKDCPFATVPIIRVDPRTDEELFRKMKKRYPTPHSPGNDGHEVRESFIPPSTGNDHEYVYMAVAPGYYYGMKATLNLWKPFVEQLDEFSSAQVWLFTGDVEAGNFCSIEAGWQVYPDRHNNDTQPRLFLYWTADSYETTGCYDLDCQGFVYVGSNRRYVPGSVLKPVSSYNSAQYELKIAIKKDKYAGDWFLFVNDYAVGYWPAELLSNLGLLAEGSAVGGEIVNTRSRGHHTKTQMGSGHYAQEGFRKAAYVQDIQVILVSPYVDWVDPPFLNSEVTNPNCYSLDSANKPPVPLNGFFYGGNGYSEACP